MVTRSWWVCILAVIVTTFNTLILLLAGVKIAHYKLTYGKYLKVATKLIPVILANRRFITALGITQWSLQSDGGDCPMQSGQRTALRGSSL